MGLIIVNFTPYVKGPLQGYLEVKVNAWKNFIIRGIAVFKNETQRWISFPSQVYEKDGAKKYKPYARFESREDMEAFQKQVFESLDKMTLGPQIEKTNQPAVSKNKSTKQVPFSQMESPF